MQPGHRHSARVVVGDRGRVHLTDHPCVPISSPLTLTVYFLPFWVIPKAFSSVCPSVVDTMTDTDVEVIASSSCENHQGPTANIAFDQTEEWAGQLLLSLLRTADDRSRWTAIAWVRRCLSQYSIERIFNNNKGNKNCGRYPISRKQTAYPSGVDKLPPLLLDRWCWRLRMSIRAVERWPVCILTWLDATTTRKGEGCPTICKGLCEVAGFYTHHFPVWSL